MRDRAPPSTAATHPDIDPPNVRPDAAARVAPAEIIARSMRKQTRILIANRLGCFESDPEVADWIAHHIGDPADFDGEALGERLGFTYEEKRRLPKITRIYPAGMTRETYLAHVYEETKDNKNKKRRETYAAKTKASVLSPREAEVLAIIDGKTTSEVALAVRGSGNFRKPNGRKITRHTSLWRAAQRVAEALKRLGLVTLNGGKWQRQAVAATDFRHDIGAPAAAQRQLETGTPEISEKIFRPR